MALVEWMYNDPADVLYIQQLAEIKHAQGCLACLERGDVVLGRVLGCKVKSTPGRRGFCHKWRYDEGVSNAAGG